MSLFQWFSRKKPALPVPMPESSGLSRVEATRPVASAKAAGAKMPPGGTEHAANRKSERMARRELLYSVVRESMVRAGVLSASYKFKVLSLDQRGRQFMVMMDLARGFAGEPARLAEIEAMIAQNAKSRYDIVVTAVYWRMNEHVAVGQVQARVPAASALPRVSQPAPLGEAESPRARPAVPRFEPIQEDEVAAFKRALAASAVPAAPVAAPAAAATAAAAALPAAAALAARPNASRYALLTGYEDTEMPDPDARMPALSTTQYGDLN
ncbi:hypothetical protein [Variovorax terrae]|uniref:Uncharacterized protein n=1 Tax=Variovorax terrae TaxID=2923278 RepID=A0A9X1VYL9_9BURK|nr:hypothetical protein [Variovorax terrae]MCJ0765673.1 hypothetical protein [Variovorax terrae]